MKTIRFKIVCWLMPTDMLLRASNSSRFTNEEIGIIGKELMKRFKTQEELEERCEQVFADDDMSFFGA